MCHSAIWHYLYVVTDLQLFITWPPGTWKIRNSRFKGNWYDVIRHVRNLLHRYLTYRWRRPSASNTLNTTFTAIIPPEWKVKRSHISSIKCRILKKKHAYVVNRQKVTGAAVSYTVLLLTYLLIPRSRVLLEKLTGFQLIMKFPAFYGTRRFITAFTSARHLSLSCARSIQYITPHPTSWISILILSSHLRLGLPIGLFPPGFPTKTLHMPHLSPIRATCSAHLILLDFISRTILGEKWRSFSSSLCSFLHSTVTSSLFGPHSILNTLFSNTLSLRSSLNVSDRIPHPHKTTVYAKLLHSLKNNKNIGFPTLKFPIWVRIPTRSTD